jgi:hypothetical protein
MDAVPLKNGSGFASSLTDGPGLAELDLLYLPSVPVNRVIR